MGYTIEELEKWNELIEQKASELGLNYYPQEFEIIGFKEMLGYEAYVGMPSRYPHWSYGKSYEKNKTLYSYNLTGLPYEMVINSNPCIAYLMRENTLLLQILTMAHVYGHNDFFKNNRLFVKGTKAKYTLEMFKLDAKIIRDYINTPGIGYKKVERIIDAAHAIRYNISKSPEKIEKTQEEVRADLINDYNLKKQNRSILDNEEIEEPNLDKVPLEPCDDVVGFIIEHANLANWEKDILKIVKRETEYFMPQIETKTINEGWASYCHYTILKELNLPQNLYLEFLKRHNDVVAPVSYGINPYYLGFKIFEDLDRKYGRKKILEVREIERDSSFIRRYLTKELCEELNLFKYGKKNFDVVVEEVSDDDGYKVIRDNLSSNSGIGGIPYIRVIEIDKNDHSLLLEHVYDGRELDSQYAKETLKYIQSLWGHTVKLISKTNDKSAYCIACDANKKVTLEKV